MEKLEILLATNNNHKLYEYQQIFKDTNVVFYSLKDKGIECDPDENGSSYKENALIKAKTIAKYTKLPVLSDDSGVEIPSLGRHFPGIHTARYALSMGGQDKTNKYIVEKCKGKKAFFLCTICLYGYKDKPLFFTSKVKGHISSDLSGSNGFGYDPVFITKGQKVSNANISEGLKNKISHRGVASKKLIKYLNKKSI